MPDQRRLLALLLLLVALFATVFVYWNGLYGPFLFDDFANLPLLGEFGRLESGERIVRYLTGGTADPLGRPVALATFLLDANTWPAEPFAFKRSNLLLHLFNGVLLYLLLARLGAVLHQGRESARLAAALAAAAWLLHPLFVSTTLYIIQREAMLTATFVLCGLLGYVAGRARFASGQIGSGTLLLAASLVLGTGLAMLCKANGVLLPLLALVLEKTVLAVTLQPSPEAARRLRILLWLLVYLPAAGLIAALLFAIPEYAQTAEAYRSWTLGERVLTQPRMLLLYLRLLFLPRAYSPGLFNDDIALSTGLFTPWSTFFALLAVVTLPIAAFLVRRRWPRLSAAILFFFAGHLLESTVVPLEMYFEHRNYLPAVLLFWPLAALAALPGERAFVRTALALGVLVGLGLMTRLHANLWSDGWRQAAVWAQQMPNSPRAQANAAQFEIHLGRAEQAERRIRTALQRFPAEPQLALNLIAARCVLGTLDDADIEVAARSIREADRPGELLNRWIDDYLEGRAVCSRFSLDQVARLIMAAEENPRLSPNDDQRQTLMSLNGRFALLSGNAARARAAFDRALDFRPAPGTALRQSALLASRGFACEALRHLDRFELLRDQVRPARFGMPMLHEYVLHRQNYWPGEFTHLRGNILDDLRTAGVDPVQCKPSPPGDAVP
ncbi:MAG: tetratricopeptide repeat protein [Rhodanobacteraceae bacterium]|nr:tetratricopeptide repeat protein [Rhodanobacteraceae bacterium]